MYGMRVVISSSRLFRVLQSRYFPCLRSSCFDGGNAVRVCLCLLCGLFTLFRVFVPFLFYLFLFVSKLSLNTCYFWCIFSGTINFVTINQQTYTVIVNSSVFLCVLLCVCDAFWLKHVFQTSGLFCLTSGCLCCISGRFVRI